jgi:hypothetical protein
MSDFETENNKVNVIEYSDKALKELEDKLYSGELRDLAHLRGVGMSTEVKSDDFETVPVGTTKRLAELEEENVKLQDWLLLITKDLEEHPEEYDGPCECSLCLSYADEDMKNE